MYASSRRVAHVLSDTMTAPSEQIAKFAISHSGLLPMRIATLSPRRTPRAWSPRAKRRASARNSG